MLHPVLLDTHCHLDQYPDPVAVVQTLGPANVIVIAVTTAPSAFMQLRRRFAGERHVRCALGVHPLVAAKLSAVEWTLFSQYLSQTHYVGEVGLDFSPQGVQTRSAQEQAFRRVLQASTGQGKLLSVHSRRAETAVLDLLTEFGAASVVFHWYSGPLGVLDHVIQAGHYCSFNPAMTRSQQGQKVIERVPPARVLVETDGPYVQFNGIPAQPTDVRYVYEHLAHVWQQPLTTVVEHVYNNFRMLLGLPGRV